MVKVTNALIVLGFILVLLVKKKATFILRYAVQCCGLTRFFNCISDYKLNYCLLFRQPGLQPGLMFNFGILNFRDFIEKALLL